MAQMSPKTRDTCTSHILHLTLVNRRSLELENGVRVLLIHDPEIESAIKTPDSDTGHRKAAAAAVLNSGFAFDPDDMPGLSHLLEHMVFMGSKEYPGEAMYHEFINRHGGAHNAFTEPERTVFFFDIDPPAFMEALSRFASFFISPLLAHDSVEREVNAVQNEFSGRASHNMVRMAHVREAVVPDRTHPSSKFGCGNIETLWNAPRDAGTLLGIGHKEALVALPTLST